MSTRLLQLLGTGLGLILISGCSDPYAGRYGVSGKVTLEGQPLTIRSAHISFEPLGGQSTATGASIENGTYTIERKDGLVPGRYIVRITAGDGVTPANEEFEGGAPGGSTNILSRDLIPPEWNVNSKQEITIKADTENVFDFVIPKAVDTKAKKKR